MGKDQQNRPDSQSRTIMRIENLLETLIDDYLKNALALIFAPYLVIIKKLPNSEAHILIAARLHKRDELRTLNFTEANADRILAKRV